MKSIYKLLTASALMLSLSLPVQAEGFKTFIDLHCGAGTGKDNPFGDVPIRDIKPSLAFGMNVTEGYQIHPMLFVGVGFGGYTVMTEYDDERYGDDHLFQNINFPFYVDARWTLPQSERNVSPFVDLKVGYQIAVALESDFLGYDSYSYGAYPPENIIRYQSGAYFFPSLGLRLGGNTACNLGVGYNFSIPRKYYTRTRGGEKTEVGKGSSGAFVVTLGVEF